MPYTLSNNGIDQISPIKNGIALSKKMNPITICNAIILKPCRVNPRKETLKACKILKFFSTISKSAYASPNIRYIISNPIAAMYIPIKDLTIEGEIKWAIMLTSMENKASMKKITTKSKVITSNFPINLQKK